MRSVAAQKNCLPRPGKGEDVGGIARPQQGQDGAQQSALARTPPAGEQQMPLARCLSLIHILQLCGEDGDTPRPFAGNVEVFLWGEGEIEYIINGDFSRSGTMEAERAGRVEVGPDGSYGVAFAIMDLDPDEQGGYCYQSGTVKI